MQLRHTAIRSGYATVIRSLVTVDKGKKSGLTPDIVESVATALDFLIVLFAGAVALEAYQVYLRRFYFIDETGVFAPHAQALAALIGGGFVLLMDRAEAYRLKQLAAFHRQPRHIAKSWTTVMATLLAIAFISKTSLLFPRTWLVLWTLLTPCLLFGERVIIASLIRGWRESGYLHRNVAVVGANATTARLFESLSDQHEGVSIIGIFDDRHSGSPVSFAGHEVLGTTDDLVNFVRKALVDEIIVALPQATPKELTVILMKLRMLPVDLRLCAEPLLEEFPILGVTTIGDTTLLELIERPLKKWQGIAKWLEDKSIAVIGIITLSPLMFFIALLIKLTSKGSIFFVQERFGYNDAVIKVLKFRTMFVECEDVSGGERTRRGDPRVTRLGRFLRKMSLDELPQFFNILKGDMSFVGPRPHPLGMTAGERPYHEAVAGYARRHRIKPGLTGWAQVCGVRGEIDSLEKAKRRVELDLYYIDNWSLLFDLSIILRSFYVVIVTTGAL